MIEKDKSFNPTFENGGYWEYYNDLEQQFDTFLNFVPYLRKNEKVYSFRLANLILGIGAHVDSAFKEIFRYSVFSSKYADILKKVNAGKANITDYRKLEPEYDLSKKEVVFKCLPNRETVIPFQRFDIESPKWWREYNKIKHEFSKNFDKANLKNARDALAGAFLLNVIHYPAANRLADYRLVRPKYAPRGFQQIHDKFRGKSMNPEECNPSTTKDPSLLRHHFSYMIMKNLKDSYSKSKSLAFIQ
jgi:hypothetical protein